MPRFVTLRPPDYSIDCDEASRAVTPRTRVIVVNTPNNKTGMIWTRDDDTSLDRELQTT